MDKRKIIKISAIVFGIFIVMAIIEISIKAISKGVKNFSEEKTEEKKQEEVYNSDAEKSKRDATVFIENIIDAINDKDYQYVYNTLDETYCSYKFNDDIENMKNFIENKFSALGSGSIYSISNKGEMYNITVKYNNDLYKHFSARKGFDGNFSLLFDSYTKFQSTNMIYGTDKFSYAIRYVYNISNLTYYVLDITNNSDEKLDLKINEVSLISNGGKKISGASPKEISIDNGKTGRTELLFLDNNIGMAFIELDLCENEVENVIHINFPEAEGL